MITEVRSWLVQVIELLLWLVAFLALLQVLFGAGVTEFFGVDVIGNIGDLAGKFGNAGLIGVVAAGIVAYFLMRYRTSTPPPEPPRESSASQYPRTDG